jgi:sialate O-acetylesterase
MYQTTRTLLIAALLCLAPQAPAAIRLPNIFGDHMVLQCGKNVPIWGKADAGEEITIELAGQQVKAKADEKGDWSVKLQSLKPTGTPQKMTVYGSSGSSVTVHDILIGEVWLGSGQSNMVLELPEDHRRDPPATIRVFQVTMRFSRDPVDVQGKWVVPTNESLAKFSWVLYQFGRDLEQELHTPIGLIQSSWGGTNIETWMPRDAFDNEPALAGDLNYIHSTEMKYEQEMKAHTSTQPSAPPLPHPFDHPGPWPCIPSIVYNAMIDRIAPFALRGFIWYQGENNVQEGGVDFYDIRMKRMIEAWRNRWSDELPFYFVQLPPFNYKNTNDPRRLTHMWAAQVRVLERVKNTAMAPTLDLGDLLDIHTRIKDPIARRLADIAMAREYGEPDRVHAGPMYDSCTIEGEKIRVKLKTNGSGLMSRDGKPLTWFEIAGANGDFVSANAEIEGDTIVVSNISVQNAVAVRFAWQNIAQPNLANKEGWPATPFYVGNLDAAGAKLAK